MILISPGGLDDPRVVALLRVYLASARAQTAPGSAHALCVSRRRSPDIGFWTVRDGEAPLAVGAPKRLSPGHGEVESMRTAEPARARGVGSALPRHIVGAARADGLSRLSLETGSWEQFRPARALYRKHGSAECPPFGAYAADPNSVFMTLDGREARPYRLLWTMTSGAALRSMRQAKATTWKPVRVVCRRS